MLFLQVSKGGLVISTDLHILDFTLISSPLLRPMHKQLCTTALSRDLIFKRIRKLRFDTNFLGAIACILISALERNHIARNSSLYAVEVILDTIPLADSSAVGTEKRLLQLVETNIVPNPKELDANAAEIMKRNPPPHSPNRLVCVILRSQHCMRAAVTYCQSVTSKMMSLNIPGTTPADHMESVSFNVFVIAADILWHLS